MPIGLQRRPNPSRSLHLPICTRQQSGPDRRRAGARWHATDAGLRRRRPPAPGPPSRVPAFADLPVSIVRVSTPGKPRRGGTTCCSWHPVPRSPWCHRPAGSRPTPGAPCRACSRAPGRLRQSMRGKSIRRRDHQNTRPIGGQLTTNPGHDIAGSWVPGQRLRTVGRPSRTASASRAITAVGRRPTNAARSVLLTTNKSE